MHLACFRNTPAGGAFEEEAKADDEAKDLRRQPRNSMAAPRPAQRW
jgi:hypothetical protein